MWRKAMHYLGLGPDEEYDDYDPSYEEPVVQQAAPQPRYAPQQAPQAQPAYEEPSALGPVRSINPQRAERREPVRVDPAPQPLQRPRPQVVRTMPVTASAKPQVVVPTSFNQAQEIADKFKGSQPVIVNMQSADRDLARRLIDFASGLCYGLGGQMEKVANQVYLLIPSNVEVSAEDRRRVQERNYDH